MDRVFQLIKKDPLFEFLTLGLILYGIYTLFTPSQTTTSLKKELTISKTQLQSLPFDINTSKTLAIYRNVLLEESYFLELYKQDKTIKDLLFQKEQLLLKNAVSVKEPTQKELYEYFLKHKNEYIPAKSYDLLLLQTTQKSTVEQLNLFQLIPQNAVLKKDQTPQNIREFCGNYLLHKLSRLALQSWTKPIMCQGKSYSFYIVNKTPQEDQTVIFQEVEDRVYNDYLEEKRNKTLLQSYKKLLQHYKIVIQ